MKPVFAAALFALALSLFPARSEAGALYGTLTPSCSKNADGSGTCFGSYQGFRASSDASAYVYFHAGSSAQGAINGVFYAELNGAYMNCVTGSPTLIQQMAAMTSHWQGQFFISWDATGACTQLFTYGMSYWN